MSVRLLELTISAVLLCRAASQIQNEEGWWIYVPIYALGAILCLLQFPGNIVWRAASAVVILFGGALVAFLIWTMHHLAGAVTSEPFVEGRNILLVAAAVAMTTGVRLRSAQYHNTFAYLRTALMMLALMIAISGMVYSLCFYTDSLPYCSLSF